MGDVRETEGQDAKIGPNIFFFSLHKGDIWPAKASEPKRDSIRSREAEPSSRIREALLEMRRAAW